MDVLKKLDRIIKKGLNDEPSVVYTLVEIRKYLEGLSPQNSIQYPNLYFYCNWVMHIKMDHSPAKKILRRFETYLNHNVNSKIRVNQKKVLNSISNSFIINEAKFYLLTDLKNEMKKFFIENNLPTDMFNGKQWTRFMYLLVEILRDCPLVSDSGMVYRFSYEKGVDKQIRFRVNIKNLGSFKITLKDRTDEFIKKAMKSNNTRP